MSPTGRRWTISHDFSFVFGGAELVTKVMSEALLPDAEVTVLAGDDSVTAQLGSRTRQLLSTRLTADNYRYLLPAYPSLLARQPVIEGDILASSYAFSHHLQCTGRKIVYCHSPFRQIWSAAEEVQSSGLVPRLALGMFGGRLRAADLRAASSAHQYVATSMAVKRRIEDYYGRRDVPLIPPPLDLPELHPSGVTTDSERDGLLWAGRVIEPYKKLALLVETMRSLPDLTLTVAGDGRDLPAIKANAPDNVRFVGWLSKHDLYQEYSRAKVLVFPSEDDFGISAVEAQAFGTPVVAYGHGGALDTVEDDLNGLFFRSQTVDDLREAIRRAMKRQWAHECIAAKVRENYGIRRFLRQMRELLDESPSSQYVA